MNSLWFTAVERCLACVADLCACQFTGGRYCSCVRNFSNPFSLLQAAHGADRVWPRKRGQRSTKADLFVSIGGFFPIRVHPRLKLLA